MVDLAWRVMDLPDELLSMLPEELHLVAKAVYNALVLTGEANPAGRVIAELQMRGLGHSPL